MNEANQHSRTSSGWRDLLQWMTHLPQPIASLAGFFKHFGFSGVVGVVVGLICAAALTYWDLWPPWKLSSTTKPASDTVYLVGSGTVREYFAAANPKFAEGWQINLADGKTTIHVLEGATGTGEKLFADVFDQVNILLMASNQRKREGGLDRYLENKPAVFEAYLGPDPLQIFLVAKDWSTLESTFSDLLPPKGRSEVKLDNVVAKVWRRSEKNWKTEAYNVFATLPPSATREEWEDRFRIIDPKGQWPSNLKAWETQVTREAEINTPSIFLGSIALNRSSIAGLRNARIKYKEFEVIGDSGRETRDLYLYGRVLTDKPSNPKIKGYEISKPVLTTLRFVYNFLDGKSTVLLNADGIKDQRDYFHLDDTVPGWVPEQFGGHDNIYRAERQPWQSQTTMK